MKVTSAYANKLIRGYREELAALISSEKDTCTTIYGASETPRDGLRFLVHAG